MTREEREDAINCFKNKLENEVFGAKYNKLALEALEQASILDKIRGEIIQSIQNGILKIESGNEELFRIIDKYKAESEE